MVYKCVFTNVQMYVNCRCFNEGCIFISKLCVNVFHVMCVEMLLLRSQHLSASVFVTMRDKKITAHITSFHLPLTRSLYTYKCTFHDLL